MPLSEFEGYKQTIFRLHLFIATTNFPAYTILYTSLYIDLSTSWKG